ncbi:MAG: RluA family pseudouridine synthase [Syntrophomonadaceae bacterium]|nr:RluA family pseudouridine synthase [Syntrophomonadaceae bacterium]
MDDAGVFVCQVLPAEAGARLDLFLAEKYPDLSRSRIQGIISDRLLTVNQKIEKPSYRIRSGDRIEFKMPEPTPLEAEPEQIPLEVLYEDQDLVVVNKPQGMVVHPAEGNYSGTLVNALLFHCRDLSGINGRLRPGIVHRIDKDTSGVLVVAKTDFAHQGLAEQIKRHSVARIYTALVRGNLADERGTVDAPIGRHPVDRKRMAVVHGGRRAVTHYRVLKRFRGYDLIEARLETGRTHQIRVHMAYIGHPLVGDLRYGPADNKLGLQGQALHATTLGFVHPRTGDYIEFSVSLPGRMELALRQLEENSLKE